MLWRRVLRPYKPPYCKLATRRCQAWESLRAAMRVNRKPTAIASKVAIATCNVALLKLDNLKVQRTLSSGAGHKVLPLRLPLWLLLWQNRTGRYASQWSGCARNEHSACGIKFVNMCYFKSNSSVYKYFSKSHYSEFVSKSGVRL